MAWWLRRTAGSGLSLASWLGLRLGRAARGLGRRGTGGPSRLLLLFFSSRAVFWADGAQAAHFSSPLFFFSMASRARMAACPSPLLASLASSDGLGRGTRSRTGTVRWRGEGEARSRSGGARGRAEAATAGGVIDLGEKGEQLPLAGGPGMAGSQVSDAAPARPRRRFGPVA